MGRKSYTQKWVEDYRKFEIQVIRILAELDEKERFKDCMKINAICAGCDPDDIH